MYKPSALKQAKKKSWCPFKMSAANLSRKRKMPAAGNEAKKPAADESPRIRIKIKGLKDGNKFMFTSRMRTPLKKLTMAYSNLVSVEVCENRFFFKGLEISPEDTPEALGMEDGAKIRALHCQCGALNTTTPDADGCPRITLTFVTLTGKKVFCKTKMDTPLYKLIETYCDLKNWDPSGSCMFLYKGRRILDNQTPNELGMEDGDTIHAILRLVGS